MADRSHKDCQHLHDALESARARLAPPQRDTSYQGAYAPVVLDPGDTTPDGSPELLAEIRELEQAIRDAGCTPDGDEPSGEVEEDARSSGVLADDQDDQREMVLRQTAEQRDALHSDGIDMPAEDDTVGEPVEQELGRKQ